MKLRVACFALLVSVLSAFANAQTKNPGAQKREPPPPSRNHTLKICQGVPIPDGYMIVGYISQSNCTHGAYLLKKTEPLRAIAPQPATVAAPQSTTQETAVSRPRKVNAVSSPASNSATNPIVDPGPSAAPAGSGEEVSEGDVVRIDTTFVSVPVSVLDRQGRFIPGLQKNDFRLFENGVEQKIAYFDPTEKPFTVALLLDTSASTRFHLWEIKEAAIAFAKQLRPQDRVLVVTFSDEVLLLTEATSDQKLVSEVIDANANSGQSTRLYDAVNLVINERLNKIEGRKAIVLFTDGVDTSSYLATYQGTLRDAEELDSLIYPIQYDTTDYMRAMQGAGNVTVVQSGNGWPFPGTSTSSRVIYPNSSGAPGAGVGATTEDYQRAGHYLQAMADKTGGRLYRANDSKQLAEAFANIAEELRRQYSIGYYPQAAEGQAGERRLIKVSVDRPNVAVRARDSYIH